MLTQTLRKLERNGVVERRSIDGRSAGVEYRLTELGATLLDPVRALSRWAEQHTDALLESQAANSS
jgi:DNA-binding HxlR family transcriptional regulator